MTGASLKKNRRDAGWTQARLAARLGLTQEYVSLMERGRRSVPSHVARAVARFLRLSAAELPLSISTIHKTGSEQWVEIALARLGYPGMAYRKKPGPKTNPAEILLKALACEKLDPRLIEALPWLLLQFDGSAFDAIVEPAKLQDLQNRFGFVVSLAREIADHDPRWLHRAGKLRQLEETLEPSRLAREDGYGAVADSERLQEWLRDNRSKAAQHWNLLTDLKREHLPYAGKDNGTVAQLPS